MLGYFGKKISIARKEYQKFVTILVNTKYDSPLDKVVSSTLLGRRVAQKIEKDKKLKRKIDKIEKTINLSKMKTLPLCYVF